MIEIKKGDYIQSNFAGFIQGTVLSVGTIGRGIPAYKIETPIGGIEHIIRGQAELLWAKGEFESGLQRWVRHD